MGNIATQNLKIIMRTRLFILMLGLGSLLTTNSQNLGDFKPKEQRGAYGSRKFKSKDVYIANFSVNYQLYNLKTTKTNGGFMGRALSGKTKASLAVGMNIPATTLQQITDDAYQNFIQDLKSKGFNVLNGDTAANTKYYEGYQRFENMEMSLSEVPGMITVYPKNTVFFVKGFTNDGKKKQGGFLGSINRLKNDDGRNSITSEIRTYSKLSSELNDATIINADVYVLFLDVKKPYQGRGAKITANTNLRIAAYEHVKSRVKNKSFTTKIGLTGKSKEKNYLCVSAIDFVSGKHNIGSSPLGTYTGVLKKDLQINDVVGKEKIQAFAKTDTDYIGIETAFGKMYRADNISVENTALIKANANKYEKGVAQAITKFLEHHVNEFNRKFF